MTCLHRVARPLPFLAGSAAAVLASGCTLIGFGIGALTDHSKKDSVLSAWQVEKVQRGQKVTLLKSDGSSVVGKFRAFEPLPAEEYVRRWSETQQREAPGLRLPRLGPGATLTLSSGNSATARLGSFLGLDPGCVWFQQPNRSGPERLPLASLEAVADADGVSIRGTDLARLLAEGKLPMRSQMLLDAPTGPASVALSDVVRVDLVAKRKGKLVGALVGAAIDIGIVAAVAASGSSGSSTTCDTYDAYGNCTSCPFVYSFDGARWVRDSEVFGGAIFEAAQRSDWAALEHLASAGGSYRVRLTNELQEVQHVDGVRLLVVDHPAGTRVVAALDGRLDLFPASHSRLSVRDLRGADVSWLVAARDGDSWVSLPMPATVGLGGAGSRDGLEFELARPKAASSVTLAIEAQSTIWASELKRELLALQGGALGAWRERMNRDAAARSEFMGALAREGLLTLRVWTGSGWRPAGVLANMATAVPREQALRIELADVPGERARFRLDSTAGMWTVDAIQAEFDCQPASRVTTLAPVEGRDGRRNDLRDTLAAVDGRRHVMEPGAEPVEVRFQAPPEAPGLTRSFVLEATGYYTILVPAAGEPQQALFERLVREPGAFGRWSADLLRADVERQLAALESRSVD